MANLNFAVIDAAGRYGDYTRVYYVGSREQCEAYARRGACQVIASEGNFVRGERVHSAEAARYTRVYQGAQ